MAAKREMTAAALLELLGWLEAAGIESWLDGGWGVDALLGEQTRPHADFDLTPQVSDVPRLIALLAAHGFAQKEGAPPDSFVLADAAGREVDVHAVTLRASGEGVYRMANGEDWIFPRGTFEGTGTVLGRRVRCFSAEAQILCHAQGYAPAERDLRDMERLAERFGLELPPILSRQRPPS
jgi:lincosamide nucleotidyltransferase A/C/D/E